MHEDWLEFGVMLAQGHRGTRSMFSSSWMILEHPVNQYFDAAGFEYRDEFFRFHEVYSRQGSAYC